MDLLTATPVIIVIAIALASRLPFLHFPMDEDFSFYTYYARFANEGIKWKKDIFVIYPTWRMYLMKSIYGDDPLNGVVRLRLFFSALHVVTSLIVFKIVSALTGDTTSALAGGSLYAFFGTVPFLCSHSVNSEQIFAPLFLSGAFFLWLGDGYFAVAGLLFGLAATTKLHMGIYIPFFALGTLYQYGLMPTITFCAFATIILIVSHAIEWRLGFTDEESVRHGAVRMQTALRRKRIKKDYGGTIGSLTGDLITLIKETLPIWIVGVPVLLASIETEEGVWTVIFILVAAIMLFFQGALSPYHYLPVIPVMAIATGAGIHHLMSIGSGLGTAGVALFAAITAVAVYRLLPFYLNPTDSETLGRYRKFDQYIYLPYLGKILKRLIRMRGESGRIFVWGDFSQLYHYTGLPASDSFLSYAISPWDSKALEIYFDTLIGGLMLHRPVYLIKTYPNLNIDMLEKITGLKYKLIKVVLGYYPVYRLASFSTPETDPLTMEWREKMNLMEKLTDGRQVPGVDYTDFQNGNVRRAIKECRKLCRLNKKDTDGHLYLGMLYDLVELPDRTIETASKLIGFEPQCTGTRVLLAKQYLNNENFEEAKRLLNEEVSMFGEGYDTTHFRGLLYQQMGEHKKAADEFEKNINNLPDRADSFVPLAQSLIASGDIDGGRKIYDKAWSKGTALKNEHLRTQTAVDVAKLDSSIKPEVETLSAYFERDTKNDLLKYALASAMMRAGDGEEASRLLRQITSESKDNYLVASTYYKLALLAPEYRQVEILGKCLKLWRYHRAAKKRLAELEKIYVKT